VSGQIRTTTDRPGFDRFLRVVRIGRVVRVPIESVDYIMAENKMLSIVAGPVTYYAEDSLDRLEAVLLGFVRVHRNCLVARDRICSIERDYGPHHGHRLCLTPSGEFVRMSNRRAAAVRKCMRDDRALKEAA